MDLHIFPGILAIEFLLLENLEHNWCVLQQHQWCIKNNKSGFKEKPTLFSAKLIISAFSAEGSCVYKWHLLISCFCFCLPLSCWYLKYLFYIDLLNLFYWFIKFILPPISQLWLWAGYIVKTSSKTSNIIKIEILKYSLKQLKTLNHNNWVSSFWVYTQCNHLMGCFHGNLRPSFNGLSEGL